MFLLIAICAYMGIQATYFRNAIPVRRLDCTAPWSDVASAGDVVIFVDCPANGYTVFHADLFRSFCQWYRGRFGRNPVLLDTSAGTGESWDALQLIWADHDIRTGGYKSFGGAGQVIWLRGGQVAGIERIDGFENVESMIQRTEEYFRAGQEN